MPMEPMEPMKPMKPRKAAHDPQQSDTSPRVARTHDRTRPRGLACMD